jgi:hypothetical protein
MMAVVCVVLTGCTARTQRNIGNFISGIGSDIVGANDGMAASYNRDYLDTRPRIVRPERNMR